jgi:hypothetical protein
VRATSVLLAIGVALLQAAAAPARPAGAARTCPGAARAFGRLAFLQGGRLELLDLANCRLRTLVAAGASPPVRWSADGRYIGFGSGAVVSAEGGPVTHPLGALAAGPAEGSPAWVWAPRGHRLAGVGAGGGVVTGGPGLPRRRLLASGWGATSLAFAPDGEALAVSRSRYPRDRPSFAQQVWLVGLPAAGTREIFRVGGGQVAPLWLYAFTPDGRWLIAWLDLESSASLAADGLPLIAIPLAGGRPRRLGAATLVDDDFLSWCGERLAYVVDRGGREVTLGDRIALAGPAPGWRRSPPAPVGAGARLSFISPACTRGQEAIAAAVGPETPDDPIGQERRRIWLLAGPRGRWRPLEPPPPVGSSDELPTWSPDGGALAFVRTTWGPGRELATGRLYLLELGPTPGSTPSSTLSSTLSPAPGSNASSTRGSAARLVGPIAAVGSTSDSNGHYGWDAQLAWSPS